MRRTRKNDAAVFAGLFAALGDETRLVLVRRLSQGEPRSISELSQGSALTRQAVTKHLRVLEGAGIVRCSRRGREALFAYEPQAVMGMAEFLEGISAAWDDRLQRLKAFVEADEQ